MMEDNDNRWQKFSIIKFQFTLSNVIHWNCSIASLPYRFLLTNPKLIGTIHNCHGEL